MAQNAKSWAESRTFAFWMYATGFQSGRMCPRSIEILCFVNLSSDEVTPKERAFHEQWKIPLKNHMAFKHRACHPRTFLVKSIEYFGRTSLNVLLVYRDEIPSQSIVIHIFLTVFIFLYFLYNLHQVFIYHYYPLVYYHESSNEMQWNILSWQCWWGHFQESSEKCIWKLCKVCFEFLLQ